jgi:hypothetical protein
VIHVDDLNMPKRETYGAQPPIEILRQWFSQSGWYDRSGDLTYRRIVDIVLVASMGPPGGGRQEVAPRARALHGLLRCLNCADGQPVSHAASPILATLPARAHSHAVCRSYVSHLPYL